MIDSGVHPVSSEFGTRIREAHNWVLGPEGTVNTSDTDDCSGHGTRVASAAVGTTYGVAKDAAVVNLRVLDCASRAFTSDVVAALDWMVNDHVTNHPSEAAVANVSIGTDNGTDSALDLAALRAVQNGITVVTSAGNSHANACGYSPSHAGNPGAFTAQENPTGASVITVAATELNDTFALYSNYGSCVDVLAPGSFFQMMSPSGTPDSTWQGTSFATPLVAGVAAIHMQRLGVANNPSMIEGAIRDNGTAAVISGVPSGTPNLLLWNNMYTRRRLCCSYP